MNTLAERLKLALANSGATKTDIWKACGISSGAVTQWFDGTTKQLEGKNLIATAKVLKVNPDWLATGKGRMEEEKNDPVTDEIIAIYDQLDDKFKKILLEQARMLDKMSGSD